MLKSIASETVNIVNSLLTFVGVKLVSSKGNDFDMILIMATRDIKMVDYIFGAPEQYIIANEYALPVMCINPRPMKIAGGFRATGGA